MVVQAEHATSKAEAATARRNDKKGGWRKKSESLTTRSLTASTTPTAALSVSRIVCRPCGYPSFGPIAQDG